MKTIRTTIITTLSLCIAAPLAYGQEPAALLAQCMKMMPGTPEQNVCITTLQTQMAVLKAQAAAAQTAAAQATAAKAGAKPAPEKILKAPDAPPDVKKAAQQLGLAGSPPPGVPGAAPLPNVNLSGMDIDVALAAVMKQQGRPSPGSPQYPDPRHAVASRATGGAGGSGRADQGGTDGDDASAMMSIGSGAAGMQAVANMKKAGLDTSKISVKNVNGVSTYEMSGKQAEAYKQELDAKKKHGGCRPAEAGGERAGDAGQEQAGARSHA